MNNDHSAAAENRLLDAALERKPHERAAFLGEACAGDEELQRAVESLLEHARDAVGKTPTRTFQFCWKPGRNTRRLKFSSEV